jgi:hypothetical protein
LIEKRWGTGKGLKGGYLKLKKEREIKRINNVHSYYLKKTAIGKALRVKYTLRASSL